MKTKNSNTVTTIREYVCKHSNDFLFHKNQPLPVLSVSHRGTLMDFKSRVNGTLELKVTQGNKVIHFLALIKFSTNPLPLKKKIIKSYVFCATQVF